MRISLVGLLATLLLACTSLPTVSQRIAQANQMAHEGGWRAEMIPAGYFDLIAYLPMAPARHELLTVYIEGDGLAWVSRSQPALDPTPVHPIALQMALKHPEGAAAYLARPCQFVRQAHAKGCNSNYWTGRRFSEEVVDATSIALDRLKRRFRARQLELVGYSGGAAVAALVAARREDVARLVTVAGNLDHRAWTAMHHDTPLTGSLNPADDWQKLADIEQIHFVGGNDRNVTEAITQAFVVRFETGLRPLVRRIVGFDHLCCWADKWAEIYP